MVWVSAVADPNCHPANRQSTMRPGVDARKGVAVCGDEGRRRSQNLKKDLTSAFTGKSDRALRRGIELTRRFSCYVTEDRSVCYAVSRHTTRPFTLG